VSEPSLPPISCTPASRQAHRPTFFSSRVVIIICVWHAGLFSLTSNSRMVGSFLFFRHRPLRSSSCLLSRRYANRHSPLSSVRLPFCFSPPCFRFLISLFTSFLLLSYERLRILHHPLALCSSNRFLCNRCVRSRRCFTETLHKGRQKVPGACSHW
jgi:hypothetical protein